MSQKKIKRRRIQEQKIVSNVIEVVKENFSISKILKTNWIFMTVLSLGMLVLFFNGLKADFVSDDYATILNNSDIHSLKYFSGNITPVVFSNFVIGNLFRVTPLPYHLFSVFFYILTLWTALIFLNLLTSKRISQLTLILFSVMPIHVEAVTWISGKPYLFMAFFIMFSTICFVKYLDTNKFIYVLLAILSFVLAIMADLPRPFSLFLVIPLCLVLINRKDYWQKFKKIWPYMLGLAILVVLIKFSYASSRVNLINSGYNQSDSIFYNPFFQYPTGIPKYLQLVFFPVDLTLYHTMYVFPSWLNWSIFLTLFVMIFYFLKKDKILFFSLTFFLVTLLPSMAPIKVSWLVAERYSYLPSLGLALFLAVLLDRIWSKKFIPITIISVWCVFFSIRIFKRNIDWQTNHNLWVNTCQVSPNSHNAWNNIGDDYDKLKDYGNALKGFTQSVLVKPNYADAYHNRANILFKIGRYDLARESYDTAIKFSPALYQTYLSLTQIDLIEKKADLALAHATKAVEIQPNDPQAFFVLGAVKAQIGLLDEAEEIFKKILTVYPNYDLAKNGLLQLKTIKAGRT